MAAKDKYVANAMMLLRQGPMDSTAIISSLSISQPTFSRIWASIPDIVSFGEARARKYALRRKIVGVDAPIPISMVSRQGDLASFGLLHPLQGGWYALTKADDSITFYQGLPFFMSDLRPQGFLGKMEPSKHADLGLPQDILRWSDDHTLIYLSRRSEHAAGNLLFGNESHARFLASLHAKSKATIEASERLGTFPKLAEAAMQGDPPGSSAGGEQPKFTAIIQRNAQTSDCEHVIVKFSPRADSAAGRRWADLLVCEHLALTVLAKNGLPAATTSILTSNDRTFLEVVRFDRIGYAGRAPMVTFAGLDGGLGMLDQTWSAVAAELVAQHLLPRTDADVVDMLDLFGALIGNVDKHHGNIAVSWAFDQPYRLLSAYDMLPMLYRPNAHGEIVPRQWQSTSTHRLQLRHLPICFGMASQFWDEVLADPRISADFKAVAEDHRNAIAVLRPHPHDTANFRDKTGRRT